MFHDLSDILISTLSRYWPETIRVDYLPEPLRGIRDSFSLGWGHGGLWVLLLPLSAILTAFLWSGLASRRKKQATLHDNPTLFFNHILDQLELSWEEKKLLGQMSQGARLCHPAAMLLSPNMLAVSQSLWQKERKGVVDPEKIHRLHQICKKLYDHYPTDSATVPV